MDPAIAIRLIQDGVQRESIPQRWADLGAGNGLFTVSLAGLLPGGSTVWAVDKSETSINLIPDHVESTTIYKTKGDFTDTNILPGNLDGVVMANALHFVHEQEAFINRLLLRMNQTGRIILIEYDTDKPNPWVPYPIAFATLLTRFNRQFKTVRKMTETSSAFGRASIYAAVLIP